MTKQDYDVKNMIKTFQDHYEEMLKCEEELDKKYPDRDWKFDPYKDFTITLALKSMCEELVKLRDYISGVEDSIDSHINEHYID